MKNNKTVYITAGEESGDMLGAGVIRSLKKKQNGLSFKGIGGLKMEEEGLVSVYDSRELGFMGFFELVKHAFVIRRAIRTIFNHIIKDKPSLILMIDFSEFHIKLAKKIKRVLPETRIIKYVSPQIWASRYGRIKDIVKYYDCVCCILPFEKALYKDFPVDSRYVGNPVISGYSLKLSFNDFCNKFGLDTEKNIISVFPGSRIQEIYNHLPVLKKFIELITAERDDIQFVLCKSSSIKGTQVEKTFSDLPVRIIHSDHHWEILNYSSVALCKSGTVTLQSAAAGTPSVVFYRVNPLSFMIAKRIVRTKFISLPNIIAGKYINPELIQNDFCPENLMREVKKLMDHEDIYDLRKKELGHVKNILGDEIPSDRIAETVIEYLEAE